MPPKWGFHKDWSLTGEKWPLHCTKVLRRHNWVAQLERFDPYQPLNSTASKRLYHYSVIVDMVSQDEGKIALNLQSTEWIVDDSVVQCPLLINPVICSKCCRPLTACYGDFAAMISQIKTQHYMSKNVDLVLEMFINTDTNLVGYLFSRWKLRTTIV